MKILTASLFTVFLLSLDAGAMIPAPGTFIPSECGKQATLGDSATFIKSICVGRVAQATSSDRDDRAAQFRMLDGTTVSFLVRSSTNRLVELANGDTNTVYRLESLDGREHAVLRAVVSAEGSVKSMTGEYRGAAFNVPQTEQMMVIQ